MPQALLLPLAILAGVAIAAFALARRNRQRRLWQELAPRLGLGLDAGSPFRPMRLSGRIGSTDTEVRRVHRGKAGDFTVYRLRNAGIAPDLSIGKEGLLRRMFGGADVTTGAAEFDQEVRVLGSEPLVLALLDRDCRGLLRELVPRGVTLTRGELQFEHRGVAGEASTLAPGGSLEYTVRSLVRLAQALVLSEAEIPDRLARNARHDPDPGVRRRCLALLLREPRWAALAREACRAALGDGEPWVRLTAACALEGAGVDALESLARDEALPSHLRGAALVAAMRQAPGERAAALLAELDRRWDVAGTAADPERLAAIAVAYGALAAAGSETRLLELLARSEPVVRVAAAEALAHVGTVRSVEPLLGCAAGLGVPDDLKLAARRSLEQVRERLGPVEAGTLSLAAASEPAGAVSLAPGTGAGLSLAVEREGGDGSEARDDAQHRVRTRQAQQDRS